MESNERGAGKVNDKITTGKMSFFQRLTPPGISAREEFRWIRNGLIVSLLFSLLFFSRFFTQYDNLFYQLGDGSRVLRQGALMPSYMEVLGLSLGGFLILALCMLPLAAWHYGYHYQGSKSIYLMKRLPGKGELIRGCLGMPLLGAAVSAGTGLFLLFLYGGFYRLLTPQACLIKDWIGI